MPVGLAFKSLSKPSGCVNGIYLLIYPVDKFVQNNDSRSLQKTGTNEQVDEHIKASVIFNYNELTNTLYYSL